MKHPLQLAVFDVAGTTVDDGDAVHRALCSSLGDFGIPASRDDANEVMGLPKPEAIRILSERKAGRTLRPVEIEEIHRHFVEIMIGFYQREAIVTEIKGIQEVFAALHKAGIKIGLDTGFSRPILETIIHRMGWREQGWLDATVCSDEVPRGRPYPDMIERLMKLTGVTEAARVAKIGDTPSDLKQGLAGGCGLVIGVTYGSHTPEQLAGYPPAILASSVREVQQLLLALSMS